MTERGPYPPTEAGNENIEKTTPKVVREEKTNKKMKRYLRVVLDGLLEAGKDAAMVLTGSKIETMPKEELHDLLNRICFGLDLDPKTWRNTTNGGVLSVVDAYTKLADYTFISVEDAKKLVKEGGRYRLVKSELMVLQKTNPRFAETYKRMRAGFDLTLRECLTREPRSDHHRHAIERYVNSHEVSVSSRLFPGHQQEPAVAAAAIPALHPPHQQQYPLPTSQSQHIQAFGAPNGVGMMEPPPNMMYTNMPNGTQLGNQGPGQHMMVPSQHPMVPGQQHQQQQQPLNSEMGYSLGFTNILMRTFNWNKSNNMQAPPPQQQQLEQDLNRVSLNFEELTRDMSLDANAMLVGGQQGMPQPFPQADNSQMMMPPPPVQIGGPTCPLPPDSSEPNSGGATSLIGYLGRKLIGLDKQQPQKGVNPTDTTKQPLQQQQQQQEGTVGFLESLRHHFSLDRGQSMEIASPMAANQQQQQQTDTSGRPSFVGNLFRHFSLDKKSIDMSQASIDLQILGQFPQEDKLPERVSRNSFMDLLRSTFSLDKSNGSGTQTNVLDSNQTLAPQNQNPSQTPLRKPSPPLPPVDTDVSQSLLYANLSLSGTLGSGGVGGTTAAGVQLNDDTKKSQINNNCSTIDASPSKLTTSNPTAEGEKDGAVGMISPVEKQEMSLSSIFYRAMSIDKSSNLDPIAETDTIDRLMVPFSPSSSLQRSSSQFSKLLRSGFSWDKSGPFDEALVYTTPEESGNNPLLSNSLTNTSVPDDKAWLSENKVKVENIEESSFFH